MEFPEKKKIKRTEILEKSLWERVLRSQVQVHVFSICPKLFVPFVVGAGSPSYLPEGMESHQQSHQHHSWGETQESEVQMLRAPVAMGWGTKTWVSSSGV